MNWKFIILIFFFAFQAKAKDIWIHATGIDTHTASQNYTRFYAGAKAFMNFCQKSSRTPECHILINMNLDHAQDPEAVRKIGLPTDLPTPSRESLLKLFREKIMAAKAGDTVIFSMDNHGSPTKTGNSCVFFGAEPICENDLKPILAKKPAGVKVLINAEACFSGAFMDLSSREICTTTWSDRRDLGGSNIGLWEYFLYRGAKWLPDFQASVANLERPLIASSAILNELCRAIRPQLFGDDHIRWGQELFNDFYCTNPEALNGFSIEFSLEKFSPLLDKLAAFSCEATGLSGEVCDGVKKIRELSPQLAEMKRLIGELSILRQKRDTQESLVKKLQYAAIEDFYSKFPNDSADAEVKAFLRVQQRYALQESDIQSFKKDKFFKKLNKQQQASVLSEIERYRKVLKDSEATLAEYVKEVKGCSDQLSQAYRSHYNSDAAAAWKMFGACLDNGSDLLSKNEDSRVWMRPTNNGGRGLYPRKFTQTDYEDAKACEQSIQFH